MKKVSMTILALLLLVVPATANQDTQSVVDRMAQALGGRDKLHKVETVYMRGKIKVAGLSGTVDDWQTSRGQHKQVVDLGDVYKETTIFDGTRGWVIDRNNQISTLAGGSLEKEIMSTYLGSFSYLFSDRMPGTVSSSTEDPTGKYYLLRFKPQNGTEAVYAIDKSSFLPFSMAFADKTGTNTIYFEDWREVDGIKMPFRYRQVEADPTNNAVVQQESIQFNTTIAAATFARPLPVTTDARFTNGRHVARMPLERVDNAIFVQARINNSPPLAFVLDTGASATVIDARRARSLGLKSAGNVGGTGTGGAIAVKFVKGVNFTLPGIRLTNQTVISLAFSKQAASIKRNFGGILGYDFISRFVVEIDYRNKTVTLYDPKSFEYKGEGKRVPITIDGTPFVEAEVKVNGHDAVKGRFEIDTGYDGALTLYNAFLKAHPSFQASTQGERELRQGVANSVQSIKDRVETVTLGGFSFQNVVTSFREDDNDKDVSGLIGNEIFRRFKVIFDYSRNEMILEPNADLSAPFELKIDNL
jgi:predicted aspartyl protease/outer membrane lipoprotein-sorting protein